MCTQGRKRRRHEMQPGKRHNSLACMRTSGGGALPLYSYVYILHASCSWKAKQIVSSFFSPPVCVCVCVTADTRTYKEEERKNNRRKKGRGQRGRLAPNKAFILLSSFLSPPGEKRPNARERRNRRHLNHAPPHSLAALSSFNSKAFCLYRTTTGFN